MRKRKFKKIKRAIKGHATAIIGTIAMIAITVVGCVLIDNIGTRTINGTYNNGTITTTDGNVWKVSNYNGIASKGNHKVTVKFDTKGTDSILDDEIVSITEVK